MSNQKPSLPKGTRDFGPEVMGKRTYLLDTIKGVFRKFGFQPMETPTMENLSVLTGKYGDEGDQLLFKVLESGDYFKPAKESIEVKEITAINNALSDSLLYLFRKSFEFYRELHDKHASIQFRPVISGEQAEKIVDEALKNADGTLFNHASFFSPKGNVDLSIHSEIRGSMKRFFEERGVSIVYYISYLLSGDWINSVDQLDFLKEEYKRDVIAKQLAPSFIDYLTASRLENTSSKDILFKISGKGLRYDLTVPFARYVAMNQHEITFPFRRYQVQPVWRADRPQKGRYREFYQCDADVVGTDALLCEAEIILMLEEVFTQLGLTDLPTGQAGYTIKINDRRLLHGLVEVLGVPDKETDLLVAIDKLDKIGEEKVLDELRDRGFNNRAIEQLKPVFHLSGTNAGGRPNEQLSAVAELLKDSPVGQAGIAALREVMETARSLGSSLEHLSFDLTLARGLSYYTGAIFEVKSNQGSLSSSISGGGRYDNLTGGFGLPGVSGVGISFGVDRIYDVLDELGLFPEASQVSTQVLFVNFDRKLEPQVLPLLSQVRQAGIAAEMYPEPVKMKKQFAYADKKGIPYAVVVGTDELAKGAYGLKNLRTGEQEALSLDEIVERIKK